MMSDSGQSSPRPLRGRPRISTPEHVQRVAIELFIERGYEATSMEDIVSASGVSRSTLFRYVSSKANLLWLHHEVYGDRLAELLAEIPAGADFATGMADALANVLDAGTLEPRLLEAKWRIGLVEQTDELSAPITISLVRVVVAELSTRFPDLPRPCAIAAATALVATSFDTTRLVLARGGDMSDLRRELPRAYALIVPGLRELLRTA